MLDFLVTSKTRRRLLQLLWGKAATGSASQLARLGLVGFASAYRELRAMQSLGLVVSERKGGADVYRANAAHPMAETLRTLVSSAAPAPDEEDSSRLRGQLKTLGAPLSQEPDESAQEDTAYTLEETVVRGVRLAHRDADVARTLPVCLYRQRHALSAERLRHHALRLGEKRSLGFFLELTAELSGDDRFALWTESLRDRRCKASIDFFHPTSRSRLQRRAAEDKAPHVARKWGFRMNMDMNAFRSTFEKFVDVA